MGSQSKISVVVPCYNAASTVSATLESALSQGVDIEVVVVDDGSVDGTADILREFGDRITILSGPNSGVSVARNRGVTYSTGEWICFLDSDDLLTSETLAKRLAVAHAADVVITDWREFSTDDAGSVIDGALREVDFATVARDTQLAFGATAWAPPAAVLYRRSIVEKIGGFREDLPVIQDARHLFDAAYHGARFIHSPHEGARYRVLPQSLSRRDPGRFWRDVLLNGQQVEALWSIGDGPDEPRRNALTGIYDHAARGLFSSGDPAFFEAEADLKRLGAVPLYVNVIGSMARTMGLNPARKMMSWLGRG